MIKITTKPSYKNIFWGNLLKLRFSIFSSKLSILDFLLAILIFFTLFNPIIAKNHPIITFYTFFIVFFLFIMPLIIHLWSIFKQKENIEYFFDENNFGFKFEETKITYNAKISRIKIGKRYIFVQFGKFGDQPFLVVGEPKDIAKAKEELLNSSYKEFIEK